MARDWPGEDVAPLIALIDDPRHRLAEDNTYRLSDAQARAILELRLARLTALGRDEIAEELEKIAAEIKDYLDILRSRQRVREIIKDELKAVRDEFARRGRPSSPTAVADLEDEDLIQREDMVVTVTHAGWIKRVPLDAYRAQKRGGKGRSGMATKEEDFVTRVFVANTHTPVLFFSSRGQVYKEKVWRLPLAQPQARGKALINLLPLEAGERITTIMPLPEDEASWETLDVMFATTGGTVRRNKLSRLRRRAPLRHDRHEARRGRGDPRRSIPAPRPTTSCSPPRPASASASRCRRCGSSTGRNSIGVRGIALGEDDKVISMAVLGHFEAIAAKSAPPIRR